MLTVTMYLGFSDHSWGTMVFHGSLQYNYSNERIMKTFEEFYLGLYPGLVFYGVLDVKFPTS